MKRLYCLLFILCIGTNNVWAQQLSEESIRLKKVFTKYQEVKDAPEWHLRLIDAFPDNKDLFMDMFSAPEKDQLYHTSHDYMMAFKHSSNSYPDIALRKSFSISTELLTWSAGPVDDLQETIYHIALNNADTFIQVISLYNKKAIADIAHFLTSSQSSKLHPSYSKLIALLEAKEQKRLAKIFRKEISDYER